MQPTQDEWMESYLALLKLCGRYGRNDAFGEGQFWLMDDNYSNWEHQLTINHLPLLLEDMLTRVFNLLRQDFQKWSVVVIINVDSSFPDMGITITSSGIRDELVRSFLPNRFKRLPIDELPVIS